MSAKEDPSSDDNVQEAREIYAWLVSRQELAGQLIRQSTKTIKNREEAADARIDLHILAVNLAAAQVTATQHATWEIYKHHFVGEGNRRKFFSKLGELTRRIASAWLATFARGPVQLSEQPDQALRWDNSLLPDRSAPHVLRLAILHPGVLEHFLPRFFTQASDLLAQKSTFRRKVRILDNVPSFGWSATKHAQALVQNGDLDLSEKGSEVETVKKLIRDLRRRYRKYLREGGARPRA
jgi:hypothetical protein